MVQWVDLYVCVFSLAVEEFSTNTDIGCVHFKVLD